MVSAEDGHEIFSCTDSRYDVTISPVIDPIDIAIQSVLSLLKFRDISLARTEYEVGHEIVLRLPIALRNIVVPSSEDAPPHLDTSDSPNPVPQASQGSVRAAGP